MPTPQAPIGSGFGPATTAAEIVAGIDLTGKIAIVTGGSAGLGLETTRQLAAAGAQVLVPVRSRAKAAAATAGIEGVELADLELSDAQSVAKFASDFLGSERALDILVNSAGIMATPFARDARGNEMQLSANHLGHFQLTRLLWPALRRAGGARIVSLSSDAHHFAPVDFDDPNFTQREYDPVIAYAQSKTACALFAIAADERGKSDGIRAFSVHPGGIVTGLSDHFPNEMLREHGAIDEAGNLVINPEKGWKSVQQGAATQVWCAVSPQLDGLGGVYCENCDIAAPTQGDTTPRHGVKPWASDPQAAARLWALSERLVG